MRVRERGREREREREKDHSHCLGGVTKGLDNNIGGGGSGSEDGG